MATEKQKRFANEYLIDLNAKQAAIRAGYSEKTAEVQGSRLLSNAKVQAEIRKLFAARAERVQVTQDYVISMLVQNVERAMQVIPVKDKDGNNTGEYRYDGSVANKALELLGKHLHMFSDKVEMNLQVERQVVKVNGVDIEF